MPVVPETELERRIVSDPDWQEGAAWGDPRPGHPEGAVSAHIEEVLRNIDAIAVDHDDRERLRLVAIVHDTFKHRVEHGRPRTGEDHHAMIARRFAERYIDDSDLLDVIELHDEAYNAWVKGERGRDWPAAAARARRLIDRLGPSLGLYVRFFRADNATGSKNRMPLQWFERVIDWYPQSASPDPCPPHGR